MIPNIQWSEVSTMNKDLILALLTLSIITLFSLWSKTKKRKLPLPPGPRGLPVVGYVPFLGRNLHLEFTKMAQTYGPIFKLKLGSKTHIVVSSSDLAKVVVREQDENLANRDPPLAGVLLTYGGQNIAWSANNAHWRNLRKLFVFEVLSKKNIEVSQTFRRSEVRKSISDMYDRMGTVVDIGNSTFFTTMSIMSSLIWGKSLGEDEKNKNLGVEFREVIIQIMEVLGTPNVSDFFPVLSKLDLQGVQRRMKQLSKKMDGILDRIIEGRIVGKPQQGDEEQTGRKDFLQILLELKEQNTATSINITQIKALLIDIIIGATDTTTTTVEWTMSELLHNPKVMQKVKDELNEFVGLNNIVEEFHIPKLQYLDAVIKETFRLHPPLPLLITHFASQSCTLGGFAVPKGSNVHVNVWAIHRDPQCWDSPLEFNPNRFLNAETKFDYTGNNTFFMPFGSGRRRCPGVPLGDKMLLFFLASMLHSFDWALPVGNENDLSGKFGVILKKVEPLLAIPSQRLPHKTLYM